MSLSFGMAFYVLTSALFCEHSDNFLITEILFSYFFLVVFEYLYLLSLSLISRLKLIILLYNTYNYIHVHTSTYMYTQVHTCTHKYIYLHTSTYMYTQVHTCTHNYIHVHTSTYTASWYLEVSICAQIGDIAKLAHPVCVLYQLCVFENWWKWQKTAWRHMLMWYSRRILSHVNYPHIYI